MSRNRRQRARARTLNKALPPGMFTGNLTNQPQSYALGDLVNALTQRPVVNGSFQPMPRNPLNASPFGPLSPLVPAALDPARRDTGRPEPRISEYPVAWNVPGNDQRPIPWTVLREAANMIDVVRRCIEVRKRHIRSLKWVWTVSSETVQEAYQADQRRGRDDIEAELRDKFRPEINRLTEFWQKPWRSNGLAFGTWLNGVLEEHLVLDAVPIYPRMTYGGDVLDLEIVDGTTIKPLLDWRGARPAPPNPAYQQVLYGFPRGEFTATSEIDEDGNEVLPGAYAADQLYYHRENFRPGVPGYGLSAVEQSLISARLYLKRQGWMLAEYDDGSTPLTWLVPDGAANAGEDWNPRQRREWENSLNDELAGQTAARHRIKLTPPGFKPEMMPDTAERYKPEYDLYLIKLLATHFGVTIAELGFTEAKGLGSSGYHEGQEDVQDRIGRRPDTAMLAELIADVSQRFLKAPPELEFQFLGLESEDEAAQDAVAESRLRRGSLVLNEDRKRTGLPLYDFPEADMPMVITQRGVVFLEGSSELAPPGELIEPVQAPPDTQPPEGDDSQPGPDDDGGDQPRPQQRKPAPATNKHATPDAGTAEQVYQQLLDDYPPEVLDWVRAAHWSGPTAVPLTHIDYSGAGSWQAGHEPDKVDRFVRHLKTGRMKPIVLVKEPDNPHYIVVDGHHRALAYRKLGRPALAYIARVGTATGPWDEMHDRQYTTDSNDSTAASAPVSAPPAMASSAADKALEAATYRRWVRRNPNPHRPFTFAHHSPAEVAALTKAAADQPDDGQVVDDPKVPDTRWPGWAIDLAVAAYWAERLRQALTRALGIDALAQAWSRLTRGHKPGDTAVPNPVAWLRQEGVDLSGPIGQVLVGVYTDGYLVGDRSAAAVVTAGLSATVDWAGWTPGDTDAARQILSADGADVGLRRLLDESGVTISSVADGRLDEVAAVLADGLEQGRTPAQIATALRGILDDPAWADMVALTETARATTAATLAQYAESGIGASEWLTAMDQTVCPTCEANAAAGPIPLGHRYPSGDYGPPAHPRCRCALIPVVARS